MKVSALLQSRRCLRGVSLAVVLSVAAGLAMPAEAFAEAQKPNFSQLFKKKKGASGEPTKKSNANSTAHSQGSGQKATTETAVVNDGSMAPFVTADSAAAMEAMAQKYSAIVSAGGWPKVPGGKSKKGSKGRAVAALNQRLFVEGYLRKEATEGEFAELFTSATEDALKRFQRNHGLAVTGVIDGPTLVTLNVPAEKRLATIRANIPRLAEYSKDLGSRYIVVNIPAQQIETVSDGKVYSIHNAVVGRPSRPTPVVMTPLTVVRFNPYWNAPASIVEKDILPRMLSKGPSKIMREMNMKVFDGVGGPEVDPDSINWRRVRVDDYHFRQEPGGSNAMATAKIEFNSPFGIYLHDTPEPHLLHTASRFYSSGCVRVDKVAILIDWILQGQDGIGSARIAELGETLERLDTTIATPPQLRVAYLTAWPAKDGVAAFRPDVYELDGSGFVVGQPLPVGETMDGQRFVLKPIPRLQEEIDTDDGLGFASLFRNRNPDKQDVTARSRSARSDSLIDLDSGKDKKAKKKTATAKSPATTRNTWRGRSPDRMSASETAARQEGDAKVDAKKKPVKQAKKVVKKEKAQAAAKKADPKAATAKKTAAQCKPGADGKLPKGCKPAEAAKKPAAKPVAKAEEKAGKTASAAN
ncbi:L,D-transpeptidase family protein [Aestuariivirga sp.]|uniref:L,D-transpeptidase family protein n=1 Tax=Aestuariivirga sp. TaxID=2650926 RepID=UPI00391D61E4